jgi:hypothetical protein
VGANYYIIYWDTSEGIDKTDKKISVSGPTYLHTGLLTDGTIYCYAVSAANDAGEGELSGESCGLPTIPSVPKKVKISSGDGEITISWNTAQYVDSYNIYWNTDGDVGVSDDVISQISTPYTHKSLTNNTAYYYKITALNGLLESGLSKEISTRPSSSYFPGGDCGHGDVSLDPLFDNQWHLENTGQGGASPGADAKIRAAWDNKHCLGDGITIAIIDDGVDLNHPDFSETDKLVIVNGSNFNSGDPNSPQAIGALGDAHGTSCAGVAAASDDGVGTIGAAPNAHILPVRLISGPVSFQDEIDAFYLAANNGAAILSNSWGPADNGGYYPISAPVSNAIKDLAQNGRDGKGTIFVWASGNGDENVDCDNGSPCDGYASHPNVLAVAATTDLDRKAPYSDWGEAIFISAPSNGGVTSGIWTTDHTGIYGYNSGNYTSSFGGTSSAAPLASGAIALLLSANPDLLLDEVCWLLKNSATTDLVTGSYPFDSSDHSLAFGYGKIDADAVLNLLAFDAPGTLNCSTNTGPKYSPQSDIGTPTLYYFYNNDRRIYLKMSDKSKDPERNLPSTISALKNKNHQAVSYSDSSTIMYLTNYIIVGLEQGILSEEREKLFSTYSVVEIRKLPVPETFVVKSMNENPLESLQISQELYMNENIRYSEPNLIRYMEKR